MDAGQSRRPGLLLEARQGRAGRLDPAEALDQAEKLVDGKVGLAVDLPVRRLREVIGDHVLANLVEGGRGDLAGVKQRRLHEPPRGMHVHPVVVGPHQRELDPVAVGRAQVAFVEGALQERAVVVPVPVEDEGIDAVVRRGVDLLSHNRRVGLVALTPKRHLRLVMSGEARTRFPDQFPFIPARSVERLVAGVAEMVVGKIVAGDGDGAAVGRGEHAWAGPVASRPNHGESAENVKAGSRMNDE